MKKCTTMLLALVAALLLLPGMARAADASGTCGEGLTWTLEGGVLSIEGTGRMENYATEASPWYSYHAEIQSIQIGDGVTCIGDWAFYNCNQATSVTIPEGVTYIGESAFESCRELTGLSLPDSLSSDEDYWYGYYGIGYSAFKDCRKLASIEITGDIGGSAFVDCSALSSVVIKGGVKYIEDYAFQGCANLTSLTISEGVVNIGNYAFSGCTGLTTVTLPESLEGYGLGSYLFSGCTGLTSVKIPEGVNHIGSGAFYDCANLTDVSLSASLTEITDSMFSGCSNLVHITLPNGLLRIDSYAFSGCGNLVSLEIPNSVTQIGSCAFENCTSLMSVNIPDRIATIEPETYSNCSSLNTIEIPDSVTEISDLAFSGCTNLSSIDIPKSVTRIGSNVFYGCSSLTSIKIPDSLTSIDEVFRNCTGLASITIPDNVLSMDGAFSGCTGLTSITLSKNLTSLGSEEYDNNYGDGTFYGCTSLTDVVIPAGVTRIGDNTFSDCTSLTNVVIPDSVTQIGNGAFSGCTSLANVTIPDGVPEISEYTFSHCSSLTSITIPKSVTAIKYDSFYYCNALTDVYYSGSKTQWQEISIDNDWDNNGILYRAAIHCSDGDIIPVLGVSLLQNSVDMTVGETYQLPVEIQPANAINQNLIWTSDAPEVASVSSTGLVTARESGYAYITVETEEGGFRDHCSIYVSDIPTYWVTFDSGRGYGYMSEAQVQKGKTYTLPECTFTAPNKMEFDCWEIGGKQYQPGDRITVTDNVTVSALWKDAPAEVYTVTFLSNGGTGTMAPVEIEEGSPCTLPACAFTAPEGKAFDHWEIDGRAYVPGNAIAVTGNVSVRAVWKKLDTAPVTCTVTFLSNGGAGTMAPVEIEEGSPYTLPACAFTAPEGKAFDHWEIGGRTYHPGDRISVTGDITVRAVYAAAQSGPAFTFEFDFSQVDMTSGTLTINIVVYMNNIYLLTIPVVLNLA